MAISDRNVEGGIEVSGLHHVGLSVRDLDVSIAFYRDRLGFKLLRQGTFMGGAMDIITGLSGTSGRSAMLRAGDQHLELFQFASPTSQTPRREINDIGISHFCIMVADLEVAYERLNGVGVTFHSPPLAFGALKATYARDPDGNVFELLEVPCSV